MHFMSNSVESLWNTRAHVLRMVGNLLELLISELFLVIFLKNRMCHFVMILGYFGTK